MTGKKPRQKTTPVDFLASITPLQYENSVLTSLVSNFGLKMSIDLIKHCSTHKEAAKDLYGPRTNNIYESKHQLYINLSHLQNAAMARCQAYDNVGKFYKDCCKVVETYQKPWDVEPSSASADDGIAVQRVGGEKVYTQNQVTSCTLGMTQWVCFILSTMHASPLCSAMVKHVNRALSGNKLQWYQEQSNVMEVPRQVRVLYSLAQILKDAIAYFKGESFNERMDREYDLEVDQMVIRGTTSPETLKHITSLADKDGNVMWGCNTLHFLLPPFKTETFVKLFNKDGLSAEERKHQTERWDKIISEGIRREHLIQ